MRIALVHDYLREYGGAERVVETLHEMWPEAPLYTAFVDWEALGNQAERFKGWDIRTSWVQKNPIVKKLHSPLRFLAPRIWESFDMSGFDIVLSSSSWFMCRGVNQRLYKRKPLFIDYIHAPPRNLYGYATGSATQKHALVRVYAYIVNFFMRQYDFTTAQMVDYFIANSKETAKRVEKFYRKNASVIYPPVTIPNIKDQILKSKYKKERNQVQYYLSVGRLMYAKRIDLAIKACNSLKMPLKIVGTGRDEKELRQIAGPTIEFVGSVSDEDLFKLYQKARALIFCALDEEFGIVPVEAMACGTPVIALAQGGVKETVVDGKTGVFFYKPTVQSLLEAIEKYQNITIKPSDCIKQAQKFSKERFKRELEHFVETKAHHKRIKY